MFEYGVCPHNRIDVDIEYQFKNRSVCIFYIESKSTRQISYTPNSSVEPLIMYIYETNARITNMRYRDMCVNTSKYGSSSPYTMMV